MISHPAPKEKRQKYWRINPRVLMWAKQIALIVDSQKGRNSCAKFSETGAHGILIILFAPRLRNGGWKPSRDR